jgi:viologen exporter family transport system permease protein
MRLVQKHFWLGPDYVRLAVKRETEYKLSFYTFVLHQIVTVAIWLVFWKVLLGKIGDFGQWGFKHMVLLTGFVTINMGIWLTFSAIWRLPREILSGEFNLYLIKPVHPFLHFMFRRLNLRSWPRVAIGVGTLIYGLATYDLGYEPVRIVLAGVTSLLSFLTSFLPFAMVCLSAFWIGRAEFLRDLFVELFVFQNYPLTEFPNVFIFVFTFVFPLIFSATVPVLVLTRWSLGASFGIVGLLVVIITVQILLFRVVWQRGLRRYESFGG